MSSGVGERHRYIPAVAITLAAVSTVLFALRLFVRFSQKGGRPSVDDGFFVAGWALGTALTAFVVIAASSDGYDRHTSDLSPSRYPSAAMIGWLCHMLFILSTSCTKISVLILYQRLISPFHNRKLLWTIRLGLVFVTSFMVVFFILPFVTCIPFTATWNRYSHDYSQKYSCPIDERITLPVAAGASAATDLLAVIIPLAILHSLKRPLRQKAGLYAVFAIGFLVVGAGVARTVFIIHLDADRDDFTWLGSLVLLASLLEHHLALMCACAPSLRPVLTREIKPQLKNIISLFKRPRRRNFKNCLRIASPSVNEIPRHARSPSFDAVHTMNLATSTSEIFGSFVAEAYDPDAIRARLDAERQPDTPLTPTLTSPERALRIPRFSGLSTFSNFTLPAHLRGKASRASLLPRRGLQSPRQDPEKQEYIQYEPTPELPPLPQEDDPALNPKFVACRGCGGYHEHGFSHGPSKPKRLSGTFNWWSQRNNNGSSSGWWKGRGSLGLGAWREGAETQSISVYADPDDLL